jgi:hypothetical protein
MSTGMLGRLPLSEVRGPRDTLEQNLAGEGGERWLKALNRFLRGENPWPIVSKVIETDCVFTPNQDSHITALRWSGDLRLEGLLRYAGVDTYDFGARQILQSRTLKLEKNELELKASGREPKYKLVILEFEETEVRDKGGLRPQMVLAEIKRLKLERPTFEDALFLPINSPLLGFNPIVFLHEPIKVVQDVGPGGMHIAVDNDMTNPAVLSIQKDGGVRGEVRLTTANLNAVIERRFAARKWVHE